MGLFLFLSFFVGIPILTVFLIFNPSFRVKVLAKLSGNAAVAVKEGKEVRYMVAQKSPFGGYSATVSIYDYDLNEDGTGRSTRGYGDSKVEWVKL